jgi:Domain of unknown function (DUF397)
MDVDLTGATWRKSTYSNGSGGNCVEVTELPEGSHALRDSKNPDGPTLIFTPDEWRAFTEGVKLSEPE